MKVAFKDMKPGEIGVYLGDFQSDWSGKWQKSATDATRALRLEGSVGFFPCSDTLFEVDREPKPKPKPKPIPSCLPAPKEGFQWVKKEYPCKDGLLAGDKVVSGGAKLLPYEAVSPGVWLRDDQIYGAGCFNGAAATIGFFYRQEPLPKKEPVLVASLSLPSDVWGYRMDIPGGNINVTNHSCRTRRIDVYDI